jgi:transposase
VVDAEGAVLAKFRIGDDVVGLGRLSRALAGLSSSPAGVQVALETDRGLLVAALVAAGYRVFSVNPKSVDRYRDRYSVSGAKSDPGDALVLAHLLRTDGVRHRSLAVDSQAVAVIAVLSRAHQDAIHLRQREASRRSLLREFFPAALTAFPAVATRSAMVVLGVARTPQAAARLSCAELHKLLQSTGRRGVPVKAAERLRQIFTAEQLHHPRAVEDAMGCAVRTILTSLIAYDNAIKDLEAELEKHFEQHPHAEILQSLPGLGVVLGARMLSEFGDDPDRFTDPAARRCYAGTAPVTRASGNPERLDAPSPQRATCRRLPMVGLQRHRQIRRRRRLLPTPPRRRRTARGRPAPVGEQAARTTAPLPATPPALPRGHRLANPGRPRGLTAGPDSRQVFGWQRPGAGGPQAAARGAHRP